MPTSSLPRRARARTGAAATLAALSVAGAALLGAPAVAAPGDNGDVKVHKAGAPENNDPKECDFYLDAFRFDSGQHISWSIVTEPHVADGIEHEGSLDLDAAGRGRTVDLTLSEGQYKLTWNITDPGVNGAGKHTVFKVDCSSSTPSPTPTPTRTRSGGGLAGPNGGPPAGGGGLAPRDFSPVAGAVAVGLVVTGGVVYLRLRRRPDGDA